MSFKAVVSAANEFLINDLKCGGSYGWGLNECNVLFIVVCTLLLTIYNCAFFITASFFINLSGFKLLSEN